MTSTPAGTESGSRARASDSSVGGGSGAKRGIERRSAISTTGNGGVAVDVEEPAPGCEGDEGEDRADADEGERDAAERDEKRRQERADRKRGHQEPLEQSEDTREQVRPRDALEQRAARDVERHPGTSRNPEQDERAKRAREASRAP